jgi:hypothetical protein
MAYLSGRGLTTRLERAVDRAVPREQAFTSRLRGPEVASRVGAWLGGCFVLALLTGVYSHVAQQSSPVLPLPGRPVSLYRLSQGLHVAVGTAAVPLLLVKMWAVYPRLFARPPRPRRDVALHALERASIAVLVMSAIFQLATGLANAAQWYPWGFGFRGTHYAVGWVAVGALLVHVAVKLPAVRDAFAGGLTEEEAPPPGGPAALTRRSLLRVTWVAAGATVVATAAAGVPGLRRVSVLAVRTGDGPGGVPVNRSAAAAGVTGLASDPDYALTVTGPGGTVRLGRTELEALPQHSADLPIACVEGWSASGTWTGVRVRDLVALVAAPPGAAVLVRSLQPRGAYRESRLPGSVARDPLTLLALGLGGKPLSLDHGYPCRVIAPNRPGVLQTKWVSHLEVEA